MDARVDDEEFAVDASFKWLRLAYEWYSQVADARMAARPIVLNADEVIARPEVVRQLCERLQLDPAGVRFEWDAVPEAVREEHSAYVKQFHGTINASSGIRTDKHSAPRGTSISLDAMAAEWETLHGPETAKKLRGFVAAAMPDYEFLCRQEMQLESRH